ncbi:MAG: NAD-dependent epimerase/dehydratase family protein [Kofleriaceae bacterium]|nr:NAD-dependent epimerase/dehydratase family protein [Kofleriaceae bacterium]
MTAPLTETMPKGSTDAAQGVRVALTGASGFIGQSLSAALPFRLRRLVRRSEQRVSDADLVGAMSRSARPLFDQFVTDTDVLVHLASGVSSPRVSIANLARDLDETLLGSLALFEAFATANPRGHIVFASSGGALYDPALPPGLRRETDTLSPVSHYGVLKLTLERYLHIIARTYGVRVTVLRIGNPYGRLLPLARAQGIVGVLFSSIVERKPFPIFGDAAYMQSTVRDYIHLRDVNQAVEKAIRVALSDPRRDGSSPRSSGSFEVYNIGTGVGVSNQGVLDLVEQVSGRTVEKRFEPGPVIDGSYVTLDISKARRELGFAPELGLAQGIELMWQQLNEDGR